MGDNITPTADEPASAELDASAARCADGERESSDDDEADPWRLTNELEDCKCDAVRGEPAERRSDGGGDANTERADDGEAARPVL